MAIPFVTDMTYEYGDLQQQTPMVRRLVCSNSGPFTFAGTNSYVIGRGKVAVVDPGPADQRHIDAMLKALEGETVTHILITHTHRDHSPAAAAIKQATGAKTYAYGPHGGGKALMGEQVEAGGDMDFVPDVLLTHEEIIKQDGWTVQAVHTPGHTSNHMCFALLEEKALFTGDHILSWSTTIVSPPDGDMNDYMKSLDILLARDEEVIWPAHGDKILNPGEFVQAYKDHRLQRYDQINNLLAQGPSTIPQMVPTMYAAVDKALHPAAQRSVLAHMIHLTETGTVACDGKPGLDSEYRLA